MTKIITPSYVSTKEIKNHKTISHSNSKANTNQLLSHSNGQTKPLAMHGFDLTTEAANLNQPLIYIYTQLYCTELLIFA
jgi:hypothetical protein